MLAVEELDIENVPYTSFLKPREVLVREEIFPLAHP
jgi:hypothetical protein